MNHLFSIFITTFVCFGSLIANSTGFVGIIHQIPSIKTPSQVLCVTTDQNGFMYCGTEDGFYIFDGLNSNKINVIPKIKHVISCVATAENEVYFISDIGIHRLKNGINKLIFKGSYKYITSSIDKKSIYLLDNKYLYKLSGNKLKTCLRTNSEINYFRLIVDKYGGVYVIGINGFQYYINGKSTFTSTPTNFIRLLNDSLVVTPKINTNLFWLKGIAYKSQEVNLLNFFYLNGNKILDSKGKEHVLIADESFMRFPYYAEPLYRSNDEIWLPSMVGLVEIRKSFFNKTTFSSILPDKVIPVSSFIQNDKQIYLGSDYKFYYPNYVDHSLHNAMRYHGGTNQPIIRFINIDKSNYLLYLYNKIILCKNGKISNITNIIPKELLNSCNNAFIIDINHICFVGVYEMFILDLNNLTTIKVKYPGDKQIIVYSSYTVNSKTYLATSDGLFIYNNYRVTCFPNTFGWLVNGITMAEDKLFLTAKNQGVYSLDLNTNLMNFIDLTDLELGELEAVCSLFERYLFIQGRTSVLIFDTRTSRKWLLNYNDFGIDGFLPSTHFMAKNNNEIAVWTSNAELFIKDSTFTEVFDNSQWKYIAFTSINDNLILSNDSNIYELCIDKQEIEFKILYTNNKLNPIISVQYLLNDTISNSWLTLPHTGTIRFNTLRDGNFDLYLKFIFADGKTHTVKLYSWIVLPPFYRSLKFYIIYVIIIIITLLAIIKYYKHKLIKNKLERIHILENKLSGLRTQLDPHFVCNILQSVQGMILKDNKFLAVQSIGEYALLLRRNFETIGDDWVLLSEEIEFIQRFVNLSKTMFKLNLKVNWEISNHSNINQIYIPAMFLQPLVENVLKHGKDVSGNIKFNVSIYVESACKILISDAGPGINLDILKKSKGSLFVLQKRIEILQKIYPIHTKLEIYNSNGNSAACVNLLLPIKITKS